MEWLQTQNRTSNRDVSLVNEARALSYATGTADAVKDEELPKVNIVTHRTLLEASSHRATE
jgi:hypothetical protein